MFVIVGTWGNEYESIATEILGYHEDKEICELKIEQFKELQTQIRDTQVKVYKFIENSRHKMIPEKEIYKIVDKMRAPLENFINGSWDLDTFLEFDFEIIEPERLTI